MEDKNTTTKQLKLEIASLRNQLKEANDALAAIRSGKVEPLPAKDKAGHQPYTLKSADKIYRLFIDKMKDGAITLNSEGLIAYCNSSFASMINMPFSDIAGRYLGEFVSPEYKEKFAALIKQGWESESKGEIVLLKKENKELPVLLSLAILRAKKVGFLSIIITDLAELKENEKQLKIKNVELQKAHHSLTELNTDLEFRVLERSSELTQSREHFKFLADNLPVIIWTAKPNGDVDYFNKRWYEYTGTQFHEVKEWGWQNILHPEDMERTLAIWNNSIKTRENYYVEYRFRRAFDQVYRWHSGSAVPFKNSNGKIIAWFGICIDIEDQKIAMTKKDEFISMVSHELKTPVTVIKAYIEVLLLTFLKEKNVQAANYMRSIDKQISRLSNLISDLLDATKINAGMMIYEQNSFDFNELVREVVDQIQVTTASHNIKMKLPEPVNIIGDRNRIAQVINNLISNAIKYSPNENKIIVSLTVHSNSIKLFVQDFGIGIPKDQQYKLFNRFFRASEIKSNTFPGLGLGLYISNEIIKRHSGLLSFKSEHEKGSIFCMELPLAPRIVNSGV